MDLFSENKSLPERASPCILRWAIMLQASSCKENGHANGLSRVPLANPPKNTPIPEDIVNFTETTGKRPVNAQQIKEGTGRHPAEAKARHCFLMANWLST